jgi:hypothetical protein
MCAERSSHLTQGRAAIPSRHERRYIMLSLLLSLLAVCSLGCGKSGEGGSGGSGGSSLHLKAPGMDEREMSVKTGALFASTKTFTDAARNVTTAATYRVYVASYELDTTQFARSMEKPLGADDQARVVFSLVGEVGSTEQTPPKAGTYSATAEKFMRVEDVSIVTRKGGQDNKVMIERGGLTGEVKIGSVAGDTVSGEISLTSGETSIKGPFNARILTRK